MDRDHFFVEIKQFLILMSPRIGTAVIRIRKSTYTCLVSIIDSWCPRPGHLDRDRLSHNCRIDILRGSLRACIRNPSHTAVRSGKEPGVVMVGQFIHRHMKCRHMKGAHMRPHSCNKGLTVSIQIFPVFITVFLHTGQEPCHRFHKSIIIHDRIPLISLKPSLRIAIMLGKNECFRICLLDCPAEIFPELMIKLIAVSKIRCHVQSPAICTVRLGNPLPGYIQHILIKLSGALIIKLRKRVVRPPSIVRRVIRPSVLVIEMKEGAIRAVCRNISTRCIAFLSFIDPLTIHPFIKGATVIKYSVQDHLHASLMKLLHQLRKKLITRLQILLVGNSFDIFGCMSVFPVPRSQKPITVLHDLSIMRIHVIIILCVILVIAR